MQTVEDQQGEFALYPLGHPQPLPTAVVYHFLFYLTLALKLKLSIIKFFYLSSLNGSQSLVLLLPGSPVISLTDLSFS